MATNDTWIFYRDARGQWRWRRKAANGRIVGASTEGYANRADCEANAARMGMELTAPEPSGLMHNLRRLWHKLTRRR